MFVEINSSVIKNWGNVSAKRSRIAFLKNELVLKKYLMVIEKNHIKYSSKVVKIDKYKERLKFNTNVQVIV